METLVIGLILFFVVHVIPLKPQLRRRIVDRIGVAAYKGLFSLLSLIGFYFIISGKAQAPIIAIWTPPVWSLWLTIVMMFFAIALVAAAYIPSNIKRVLANPMLWGVLTWSIAHLLTNGDAASMLLFGSFAVFAFISIIVSPAKPQTSNDEMATKTLSFSLSKDITLIALSIVIYTSIIALHFELFGKAIFISA